MKCTFAVYVHHTPTSCFIISFMSFRHGAIIYNLPDHIIQPTPAGLAHRGAKKWIFPPVLEWLPKIRLNFGALNCCNCGTKNLYFLYLCLLPLLHLPSAPSPPLHHCPTPTPTPSHHVSTLWRFLCAHPDGVSKGDPNHLDSSLNDYSDLWHWLQPWSPRRSSS